MKEQEVKQTSKKTKVACFISGGSCLQNKDSYSAANSNTSPKEIAAAIQKHIPEFTIDYAPDFRQQIADGWPKSIDDSAAREHWNWKHEYDLDKMTADMLKNLAK